MPQHGVVSGWQTSGAGGSLRCKISLLKENSRSPGAELWWNGGFSSWSMRRLPRAPEVLCFCSSPELYRRRTFFQISNIANSTDFAFRLVRGWNQFPVPVMGVTLPVSAHEFCPECLKGSTFSQFFDPRGNARRLECLTLSVIWLLRQLLYTCLVSLQWNYLNFQFLDQFVIWMQAVCVEKKPFRPD